jgi:PleD family two-component response regulator
MKKDMKKMKKILCIDDSNTSLLLLGYTLTNAGYKPFSATNVEEAILVIKSEPPDLILLDLSMPEVSGYDFLKMRSDLQIENVPIIVISAYDSRESVKSTQDLGATDFITKPIKIEFVLQKIKQYLS